MTLNNFPLSASLRWIQKNLFSSWFNSLLTIVIILIIYWLVTGLLTWALTAADWTVISANIRLFFVGRYPVDLIWRTWLALGVFITLGGFTWGCFDLEMFNRQGLTALGIIAAICVLVVGVIGKASTLLLLLILVLFVISTFMGREIGRLISSISTWLNIAWVAAFIIILWILQGGIFLEKVKIDDFSGLLLTVLIALVSIVLCFPFGVLLALGRKSDLPVIRWLSIAYIELVRALPLVGILFMAQVMLPLLLPGDIRPPRVMRAIAGLTIFSAAYLAENVRGGLQAIPIGQTEAAKALGLSPPMIIGRIILPQALRAVIPTIVGQFISLFKDTSLLTIVGLFDLLGMSQAILANPNYTGHYAEVYLFIAAIYWVCCSLMSSISRKLEKQSAIAYH